MITRNSNIGILLSWFKIASALFIQNTPSFLIKELQKN